MPFWAQPLFSFNSVKNIQNHIKVCVSVQALWDMKRMCCQIKLFWFAWHTFTSSGSKICYDIVLYLWRWYKIRYSSSNDLTFEDFIDFETMKMKFSWLSLTWSIFPNFKEFRIRLKFRAKIFSYRKLKIKEISLCNKFEIYLNCSIWAI